MDKKTLERTHRRTEQLVFEGQLKEALDGLRKLVAVAARGEYFDRFTNISSTYEALLRFVVKGVADPERPAILRKLSADILELADLAYQTACVMESDQYIYKLKKRIEYESSPVRDETIKQIESLVMNEALAEVLEASLKTGQDRLGTYRQHHELMQRIFDLIWLTDRFQDSDADIIRSLWNIERFPWYEKAVLVSALTLSNIRCFDLRKTRLLIDMALDPVAELRQRALVGIYFVLTLYSRRLTFYPSVFDDLARLREIPDLDHHFELITTQLVRSRDTEKLTRKLHDEIIPEMVRYQPVIKDKLDLDNILDEQFFEDKNPDWEEVFEDAPDLLDKLQEISKLQMDGADVFMGTFAQLKHFDFFREMINWFIPFYPENAYIRHQLEQQEQPFKTDELMEGLSHSFFMCNSDKYSFCLNIPMMPDMQKKMLIEMFRAEVESLKELQKESELLNKPEHIKSIYTRYIHDLYRFFKLHPMKNEFFDVFSLEFAIHRNVIGTRMIQDKKVLRNIGEFFFEQNHFELAAGMFHYLEQEGVADQELFEKTGYALQKLRRYEEAISSYKKAELFEYNRAWNLKKLAFCYRQTGDFETSLKYYLEAERLEPDNLYVLTYIGHNYLDLKQYDKALEYYFKVEVLAEENLKILRPVAWCAFVLGKLDTAKRYISRVIEAEPGKYDYMTLGHIEWCMGNREAAIDNYKLSISRSDNNFKSFLTAFESDRPYLEKNGIPSDEIPLLLDWLRYQLQ
ncbi:MAG: tetratricopeptide repeat protein [Bacteroidales bacterium]